MIIVIFAMTHAEFSLMRLLVRGLVLSILKQPYIGAAEAAGCSLLQMAFCHILPNALGPVIAGCLSMQQGS